MIQRFRLDKYDWDVTVYYLDGEGTDTYDAVEVELVMCGCKDRKLDEAMRLIESGEYDTGLTFSNTRRHESVMVIGKTSSAGECANTMIHERKHLEYHICQAYGIDPFSEEASYLAGDIGGKMYRYASVLLCKDCRRHYLSFAEE